MLRGYYIAASGMINQQRKLDAISNNIANVKTSGYKSDSTHLSTFGRELILVAGRTKLSGSFSQLKTDATITNLEQGAFESTGSSLDMAIDGPMYFNIQGADGKTYLTRNGQFTIDDEGYLALGKEGRVLGKNGPIQVNSSDFVVGEDGTITMAEGGQEQLALTYVADDTGIEKNGKNLVTAKDTAAQMPEGTTYSVTQGSYERSNVDAAAEMTRAITVQRSFEAASQALKLIDTLNARTATELAKV